MIENVKVIRGEDLTTEHVGLWTGIQRSNPALRSPFLSPEYTLILASLRDNVRVGILEGESGIMGFFPFEAAGGGKGTRLGMCDYQGVIIAAEADWNARDLIRLCGLKTWEFDHLIASQAPFRKYHRRLVESPIMDLRAGYEAFAAEKRSTGTEQIKMSANLLRKLARDVGPLRFVPHLQEPEMLWQLLRWADTKRKREIAIADCWAGPALERMLSTQHPEFSGMLSVLYAGEEPVAAHFGIRSREVLHYWWPAYNPRFASYSPGIGLLLEMARSANSLGIQGIDLGIGDHAYKQRLMNASVPLAAGRIDLPSLSTLPRILFHRTEDLLRSNPALLKCARAAARFLRHRH